MLILLNMDGFARPVRMEPMSSLATLTAFSIFSSASSSASSIIFVLVPFGRAWRGRVLVRGRGCSSGADQRADPVSGHRPGDVALLEQIEHQDRHLVVHTQTEGGRVGDLEFLVEDLAVGDLGEHSGVRVGTRVRVVDPSTALAMRTTSALISSARWAAVVSVEKYGMPIPAPKMTTRPFSR